MGRNRYGNRRRPEVILDAGYVSIRPDDIYTSSRLLGLHGKKLVCFILTVLILFAISFINFTCLIWIMYKLDWSPFHKSGSKVFRFDKNNNTIEIYKEATFYQAMYTTKVGHSSPIDLVSETQAEMHGGHNSISLDSNQIIMNTENFYLNDEFLVDFNDLQSFKFYDKVKTKVHLGDINTKNIRSQSLSLSTDDHLSISNVNRVQLSSKKLNIAAVRNHRGSILRFDNHPQRKKSLNRQQKSSYGNLNFFTDSIFLSVPHLQLVENAHISESRIYRLCICNTTLLLLRSFAYQPCPLC